MEHGKGTAHGIIVHYILLCAFRNLSLFLSNCVTFVSFKGLKSHKKKNALKGAVFCK